MEWSGRTHSTRESMGEQAPTVHAYALHSTVLYVRARVCVSRRVCVVCFVVCCVESSGLVGIGYAMPKQHSYRRSGWAFHSRRRREQQKR